MWPDYVTNANIYFSGTTKRLQYVYLILYKSLQQHNAIKKVLVNEKNQKVATVTAASTQI